MWETVVRFGFSLYSYRLTLLLHNLRKGLTILLKSYTFWMVQLSRVHYKLVVIARREWWSRKQKIFVKEILSWVQLVLPRMAVIGLCNGYQYRPLGPRFIVEQWYSGFIHQYHLFHFYAAEQFAVKYEAGTVMLLNRKFQPVTESIYFREIAVFSSKRLTLFPTIFAVISSNSQNHSSGACEFVLGSWKEENRRMWEQAKWSLDISIKIQMKPAITYSRLSNSFVVPNSLVLARNHAHRTESGFLSR